MWLPRNLVCLLLLVFALGCGYRPTGLSPVSLPGGIETMAMGDVDNPSLETRLVPLIRSELREEFNRRSDITWAEPKEADGILHVRIHTFTSSGSLKGENDDTVKFEAVITLEAKITDGKDKTLIWNSGIVRGSETYHNQGEQRAAEDEAVNLAVREIVNKLGRDF